MDESNFKWHRAFVLLVAGIFSASVGAVAGFQLRDYLQRQRDAAKPLVTRPVAQNPPPSLYPCTDSGRLEYAIACRAQKRMTAIGLK